MRSIIVIGTDTGVGKTTVAAALARSIRYMGVNVGVIKPFAASEKRYSNKYRSEDAAILAKAAGVDDEDNEINPFFYRMPTSPYLAACIARETAIAIPKALSSIQKVAAKHELLIIEGIGGLMVPLTENETFADLAKAVGAPIILVARCKAGVLNHILLTLHVSRSHGLRIAGVVLNLFPPRPNIIDKELINVVKKLTGAEVLCVIPRLRGGSELQLELKEEITHNILGKLDPCLDVPKSHISPSHNTNKKTRN